MSEFPPHNRLNIGKAEFVPSSNKSFHENHTTHQTKKSDNPERMEIDNVTESRSVVLTPSPDANFSILDGEAVLLNLDSGFYYTLNEVGTVIWQLIDGRRTLHEISVAIFDRFDISQEQALSDLTFLVNHLCAEGLLQITSKDSLP